MIWWKSSYHKPQKRKLRFSLISLWVLFPRSHMIVIGVKLGNRFYKGRYRLSDNRRKSPLLRLLLQIRLWLRLGLSIRCRNLVKGQRIRFSLLAAIRISSPLFNQYKLLSIVLIRLRLLKSLQAFKVLLWNGMFWKKA